MKYNFTTSANSLIVISEDSSYNETFLKPTFSVSDETLTLNDFGIKKNSFSFNEIGTIGGVTPTDLTDSISKLTVLIENFNSGGGSPQLFKGKYTSLSALQTAHSTANIGEYAQVDVGIGSNVVNYIWDEQDGWVKSFISDLNFSQAEKDNINNKVGYFHKYIAPTENYITGHLLETEVHKFTVSGGTLSNIDRISLEELSVFHSAAPTGTDGVRIRISTNGVFSTSLPVIATFNSTTFFTNLERNSITFRNGNIIVFHNINGVPTDNAQGAGITRIPYNTANNYTFHISIQLANPANSACLNALIFKK